MSFAAAAPVSLDAGDGVAFRCAGAETGDFTLTRDGICIRRAGSYMVLYTVHVPADDAVCGRFALSLNGEMLADSTVEITSMADGSTGAHSMHALVHARENSLLRLVSLSPVSLCGATGGNVFTLTIVRMD